MTLDPLVLSRLQFAWVVAWHILLPAVTIGLASYIALLEGIYFTTGKEIYDVSVEESKPASFYRGPEPSAGGAPEQGVHTF